MLTRPALEQRLRRLNRGNHLAQQVITFAIGNYGGLINLTELQASYLRRSGERLTDDKGATYIRISNERHGFPSFY